MVESRQRASRGAPRYAGRPAGGGPPWPLVALAALLVVGIVGGLLYLRRSPEPVTPPPGATPGTDQTLPGDIDFTAPARRLGLHVTDQELAIWRQRAADGPYRVDDDVSENSPGDWTRITEYADAFMRNPAAGRWDGPTRNNPGGCVLRDGGRAGRERFQPPVLEPSQMLDAAFYALVAESRPHAQAVKDEMLAQARTPGVQFADRTRWCVGEILDGSPGFHTANWLTKFVFAADYLQIFDPHIFTPQERGEIDSWLASAADWMRQDTDLKLDELFVDRPNGDYRLNEVIAAPTPEDRVAYYQGPAVTRLQSRFNNRVAREARFVTLVGVAQQNQLFIDHGKRFVKDALRFTYFPQGAVGDFERWEPGEPIKGWKYGAEFAGALVTIADVLARAGDVELFEYTTTEGALGTEGAHQVSGEPKSLRTLVSDIMRYVDHTYLRYGTDDPAAAADPEFLIDSVNERDGTARINDVQTMLANLYYRDPYIRSVYTREAPGAPPYPRFVEQGAGDPEGGEGGTLPAVLFMWGGLEDEVWPYPEEAR